MQKNNKGNSMVYRGKSLILFFSFCILLIGCAPQQMLQANIPEIVEEMSETQPKNHRKNMEFNAVLRDPVIRRDFDALKSIARYASTTSAVKGQPKFSENTIRQLNKISEKVVARLHDHYHIDAQKHKTNVSIARYKKDSCYQYFNSSVPESINKSCNELTSRGNSCELCNSHVDAIKARNMKVINSVGWLNQETTVLISTFRLKNKDLAYIELQLSHP